MKKYKKLLIGIAIFLIITILNITIAFFVNPKQITIREEKIYSNKISETMDGLTVTYFSDLHFGTTLDEKMLETLVDTINSSGADIVIFGGDLIDTSIPNDSQTKETLVKNLKQINYKIAKIAVMGDEDNANKSDIELMLKEANFEILNNQNKKIFYEASNPINIVGIDSKINGSPDIYQSYDGVDNLYFTLTISHCPDTFSIIDKNKTDYVLSAHSLGGPNYFPLINFFYRPDGAKDYFKGKTKINDTTLDITNGVGLKDQKTRFFSDSEIVIYQLFSQK